MSSQSGYESGVLRFARKFCQDCGSECLESDPRCWACGGWSFQADGAAPELPVDRTLSDDEVPAEVTHAWRRPGPSGFWWWTAAAAGGTVILAGLIGFWLGRSSAVPVAAAPAPGLPKAFTTQVLPPPPVNSRFGSGPVVEIRPVPARPSFRADQQPILRAPRVATNTLPGYAPPPQNTNPAPPALEPPRVAPHVAAAAAPGKPPPTALDAKTALVSLRNEAGVPVELHFDGFNGSPDEMISVATGAAFDVPMTAGDYRLRAVSSGAGGDNTKIVLAGRQHYAFVVGAAAGSGAPALKIHEPAVDPGR